MSWDLAPGVMVAGFEIESLLGRGAMATVYRARGPDGDSVALKLFDAIGSSDERFRGRFMRESVLARGLDHPHIVRTLSSGESDGRLFLALQLIEGTDLRRSLRSGGRLEPERAVELVVQIADALDAAHAAGLVHRDVKPGNILIDPDGTAYVCDFGLARHVASVSSLTGDRGFVGTIDYVPPEQIEGSPVDARADVYSLGCVLYECLTGVRPFDRDSELAVVFAHLNEPPPRPTDIDPDLPVPFDDVIANALAKRPDDRYASCGELAAAANAALRGQAYARRRPRRRLYTVGAASGLVVAAIGIAAAILLSGGGKAKLPVTITPTSIEGARLGDSSELLQRIWSGGQAFSMSAPANYSVLTARTRNLSAYFAGTNDKAVEITTWNSRDRTAEGIGPCSTLAQLKRAYGSRLKPNPHSTHEGVVSGWYVGKHLYFSMVPANHPTTVDAVGIFSDNLASIGYDAANEAPCGPAAATTPIVQPVTLTVPKPKLVEISSKHFVPGVVLHVSTGWKVRTDTPRELRVVSQSGVVLDFALDPFAVSQGKRVADVSGSPLGLTKGLQRNALLHVATPRTELLGHPALSTTILDLGAPSADVTFLGFASSAAGFPVALAKGSTLRLYLTPVRLRSVVHTLAIAVAAPSAQVAGTARTLSRSVALNMTVDAAPVQPLSALSSLCQPVFYGTCKGELDPGTHTSDTFQPKLTYTVPPGWTNFTDHKGIYGLVPPGSDWENDPVNNDLSDVIFIAPNLTPPRTQCGSKPAKALSPSAYLAWMERNAELVVTNQHRVELGGLSGYVLDARTRKITAVCPGPGPGYVPFAIARPPTFPGFQQAVSTRDALRLYLLRYHNATLGIIIFKVGPGPTLDQLDAVVKTFRFAQD